MTATPAQPYTLPLLTYTASPIYIQYTVYYLPAGYSSPRLRSNLLPIQDESYALHIPRVPIVIFQNISVIIRSYTRTE